MNEIRSGWLRKRRVPRRNLSLRVEVLEDRTVPAAFTPGNLVVYRVGDGSSNTLIATGNPVFLDEYTPAGVLVQSIALPTTASGAQKQLVASGTATSEGLLTRSVDGRYLILTGYASDLPGGSSLSGTSSSTVNRTVGRVDVAGNVDTSTALNDFATGSNPRAAVSTNGTDLWVAGGAGGVRYTTLGSTTSTQLSTTVTNIRQVNIFADQLYVSDSSGSSVRVGTVGTGLPTTSGQTITNLPGFPTSGSPYGFFFADLSPSVPGLDTVYVAEDTTGGGQIQKYSLVGGSWTATGTVTASGIRGLTGVVGTNVTLYGATGGSAAGGSGSLYSFADTTGYNGTISGTATPIASLGNGSNKAFRGIALAPVLGPSVSSITRLDANPTNAGSIRFQVKFSASVSGLDTGDFTLTTTGVSGASVSGVSGSADTYTVTVNTGSGDGTIRLDLTDNDSVVDGIGTPLGGFGTGSYGNGSFSSGDVYTIDKTAPKVSDVTSSTPDGSYGAGATVSIQVKFGETVTVSTSGGTPTLALNSGGTASYSTGSGSDTLTFTYTVAAHEASADLDYAATTALSTGGGSIRDAAGNDATLTLPSPGGAHSLGGNKNIVIDATLPQVTGAGTLEDTQTASGLVVTRDGADSTSTHFKITNISNGTLFLSDGTTQVSNGSFITLAQGAAGLKFTPGANLNDSTSTFGFKVQAATGASDAALRGGVSTASVSVTAVNDAPTFDLAAGSVTVDEDSGAFGPTSFATNLSPGGGSDESGQKLHFTVTNNNNGLFSGQPTIDDATGKLTFTPNANAFGTATVTVVLQDDGGTASGGQDSTQKTFAITVNPAADTPSVTGATTPEDTQTTSGLVVTRNAADGSEVTHFKVTNIRNGTLYLSDGATRISSGDFITAAQGAAGLKFTPGGNLSDANTASFGFDVQAATSSTGGGLSPAATATVHVTPVADTPSVTGATTPEDTQTTSGLVVTRNAADGTEVTHFKVTNIRNGTLYKSDGVTRINSGDSITVAEGGAGLRFTPTADLNDSNTAFFGFDVQGATSASGDGLSPAATATVHVSPVADAPSVTGATTPEDSQTTSGLIIARNGADGAEVTHFKVTNVRGGSLYKSDGSTRVNDGDFITVAEGGAGLKFTPGANLNDSTTAFGFDVQAATSSSGDGLSPASTAVVHVTAVNDAPTFTLATTAITVGEDSGAFSQSGFATNLSPGGGSDESGQKVTLTVSADHTSLFSSQPSIDGAGVLTFTPAANAHGLATVTVTAQDDGGTANGGQDSTQKTFTITISPAADTPSVTGATTPEDTQTTSGLVVSRNAADGAEVTHFKVTNIKGGTLFKGDGVTQIHDGDFITAAEGGAGLKFTPGADLNDANTASFGFDVQASIGSTDAGLGGGTATAVIHVTPVAETPTVTGATTPEDTQTTSGLVLTRNAADGAEVTHFKVTNVRGGTLYKHDGVSAIGGGDFITAAEGAAGLRFTPASNLSDANTAFFGFDVQGATSSAGDGLSPATTATVHVTPVADTPMVTGTTTLEDTQSSSGLVVTRNAADGAEVTHYKVTNIRNGALYKSDGTTRISGGDFITVAEGGAGLKFTPGPDLNDSTASFGFDVQAATSSAGDGLSPATTATVLVTPVNDQPSLTLAGDVTVFEDSGAYSQSGFATFAPGGGSDEATQSPSYHLSNTFTGLFTDQPTVDASSQLTFTLAAGVEGTATVSVDVDDGGGTAYGGVATNGATFTITVLPRAHTPSVTDATTPEDTQTTSGLVITRNAADGSAVSHYKVTNITGGTLYKHDGVTPIHDGDFITAAEGGAGLKFTPGPDLNDANTASFGFDVQASVGAADAGLGGDPVTATVHVTPVADTPGVTDASTAEDTQSSSGLVVTRNAADGAEVTHFKLTNIEGGTLFKSDGVTQISDGDFITAAEGAAGLRFTPAADLNDSNTAFFGFDVQGATSASGDGLSPAATATVHVSPVADAPSVTGATTPEDTQTSTGLVVTRNAADASEVTHFKVTNVRNGTLYKSDGVSVISGGDFITAAEGAAGLRFTPDANLSDANTASFGFDVQASVGSSDSGLGGSAVTATVHVTPVADTPSVTGATTPEDTQTTSGLVITRNAADGAEVTHFRITNVLNGTLYKHDGVSAIGSGDFITAAEGAAGLKFTPAPNFFGSGSFQVQAATSSTGDGLSNAVTASIAVTPVADTPSVTGGSTTEDTQTTSGLVVTRNAADGSEVTHFKVTNIRGGTLYKGDGVTQIHTGDFITAAEGGAGLKFTPGPDLNDSTTASFGFDVQASIGATDAGLGGGTATATVHVTPVNDPPTFNAHDVTVGEDAGPVAVAGFAAPLTPGGGADETGQTLSVDVKVTGTTGNLSFLSGPTLDANGDLHFQAAADSNGTATVRVTVGDDGGTDHGGADTTVKTFTITVNAVDDPPTFSLLQGDPPAVLKNSGPQSVAGFAGNFSPGPATATDEAGQTLARYNVTVVGTTGNLAFAAGPAIDASGRLTYAALPGTNGTASVRVTVSDSGGAESDPQFFRITVVPPPPPTQQSLWTRWLNAAYVDLIGRPPTPGELAFQIGRLENGASRVRVALDIQNAMRDRPDWRNVSPRTLKPEANRTLARQLFRRFLGVTPSSQAVEVFAVMLDHGQTPEFVAALLLGQRTDPPAAFVTGLYRDLFGRGPTPGELRRDVALLGELTRTQLAARLLDTDEARADEVRLLLRRLLGRVPADLLRTEAARLAHGKKDRPSLLGGGVQPGVRLQQVIADIVGSELYYRQSL